MNDGSMAVSLDGWAVYAGGELLIVLSGSIPGNGYFLIERTDDNAVSDIPANLTGPFKGGGLSNSGESLALIDFSGAIVDSVDCSGGWFGEYAEKESMERIDVSAPGNDLSNWAANNGSVRVGADVGGNPIQGTPKHRNSVSAS